MLKESERVRVVREDIPENIPPIFVTLEVLKESGRVRETRLVEPPNI